MATVNISVTQSIEVSPDDLTAGTPITYSIDNPLDYPSYVVIETTKNAGGFYDSTSPQNLQGVAFPLGSGVLSVISDSYKAGIVVAPGGDDLVFIPDNNIISSSLLLRGTGT